LGQVVLDGPGPVLWRHVLDLVPAGSANDVDANVDASQYPDRLGNRTVDLLALRHISDDRMRFGPEGPRLIGNGLGASCVDVDAGQARTGPGQLERGMPAVTSSFGDIARPRNDGASVLEA
jgi:hypothetical protein